MSEHAQLRRDYLKMKSEEKTARSQALAVFHLVVQAERLLEKAAAVTAHRIPVLVVPDGFPLHPLDRVLEAQEATATARACLEGFLSVRAVRLPATTSLPADPAGPASSPAFPDVPGFDSSLLANLEPAAAQNLLVVLSTLLGAIARRPSPDASNTIPEGNA